MNGFHLAHIVSRLTRASWPRRVAIFSGLIVLSLVMIGLAWRIGSPLYFGSRGQPRAIHATLADAPSWDQVKPSWDRARPAWPKYLPELPAVSQTTASKTPDTVTVPPTVALTITPAVIHGPAKTVATPPSIVAGPELFGPTIQPVAVAKTQIQPTARVTGGTLTLQSNACGTPMLLVPGEPTRQVASGTPTHPVRSEAMEKIAAQADQQIRHGYELANRGAYFAARAEFTTALRLIAQGLDNDRNATVHSHALTSALTAMKEAQDFIPAAGKLEGELDLLPIVASHRTPVLKNVPPEQLQAMRALKQYFTFAQQQLALAAGQEISGSMALGALGKMHAALAGKPNPEIVAPAAKAIVFFHAAILVCPRNYMAANDLGVLLAHSGDSVGACRVLEHSVLVCRCSENLSNLSVVYRQVGQHRLAELAMEKAQVAKAAEIAQQKSASLSAGGKVQWVDPTALVQSPGPWTDPPAKPATTAEVHGPGPASSPSSKPVFSLVPAPYGSTTTR
ncbi:MAG: hypothetical protein WCJ35_16905 [Planctomycetota bacterium]